MNATPDKAATVDVQIGGMNSRKRLTGQQRAAILLLALGPEYGERIWESLDEMEVRVLSHALADLGTISTEMLSDLLIDFVTKMSNGTLNGNVETTERLLSAFLPDDKVKSIMEEIRGPAGRNMWEKLSNVQETVLANYLKNEYPQTIAVVLSKIRAEHASKVLSILPEDLSREVVSRMLQMEAVQKEILDKVEMTLRTEFMSNLSHTQRRDSHELMAEIFNNFDRQTEARFLTSLEEENLESAEKIKSLMFTFDDLKNLDAASCQTLLRNVEKDTLAVALKGANDTLKDFFLSNMSQRASKMLAEDMEVMGPVRLSDVDEQQTIMVNLAKDLSAKGEIMISKSKGEDEFVY